MSELLNFLSVSRLFAILNKADGRGVVCKLQKLDRGVFEGADIGVQKEEQWGENTSQGSGSVGGAAT